MITIEQIQKKFIECLGDFLHDDNNPNQIEFAKLLGVSQPQISRYLSGENLPPLDVLANFCEIAKLSSDYILCLSEEII